MELTKTRVLEIFDLLAEREQNLIYELMLRLVPDDIMTQDDLKAHLAAVEEFRQGETTDFDDINWD